MTACPAFGTESQPNILFIFSDDHSFYDTGAYDNHEVQTPNIDALALRGTTFERAYNMGSWSGAVCIPSRTMMQSGLFLWNAQDRDHEAWQAEGRYWPQQMSKTGYRTYYAGKWHVPSVSPAELYDMVRNIRPGMPNQTDAGYQRPRLPSQEDPWDPTDPAFEGFWRGGKHWSEVVVEDFEIMLDDAQEHDQPFFMMLAFNAPHDPRQSPHEFVKMYPQEEIRVPENFLPEYPYNEAIGSGRNLRDERLAPFPRTPYATRVQRQEYYAIITHMDHQIGRLLRALEASGEADDTINVYSSDHGLAVGQHGLMGKQNMYEHSLRVPFIVAGPGVDAQRRVDAPIYLQDIVPTTLELAGAQVPEYIDFNSLVPLLEGQASEHAYDAIYGAYLAGRQRAVIHGQHKLILYPHAERVRLFDLSTDPYEIQDLSSDESYADRIRELLESLQQLQEDTGDSLDLEQAFPEWFKDE